MALTYLTARRLTSPVVALWSGAMLALSPLYIHWSVRLMSDVPAATLAAAWAALIAQEIPFFTLGLVSGLAGSVRLIEVPLLLVGATLALRSGRRTGVRFGSGAVVGLLPIVVSAALTGVSPSDAYGFWHAPDPGNAFTWKGCVANAGEYFETVAGVAGPRFYTFVVPPLVALGAWIGLRSRRATMLVALLSVVVLHLLLALFYFFHASRLLLPTLPLLLVVAACGLEVVWSHRPAFGAALALFALVLQFRAAWGTGQRGSAVGRVGPALTAAAEHLPADVLVVSDVCAPLAWMYWIRGTHREFMPLAALPSTEGDLGDPYVGHLRRLALRGETTAPVTFLEGSSLSAAGRAASSTRSGLPIVAVVCTDYGQRTLAPALVPGRTASLLARTPDCALLAVHSTASSLASESSDDAAPRREDR